MLLLIYLLIAAKAPKHDTNTGMTRCLPISRNLPDIDKVSKSNDVMPCIGSQPRVIPKNDISIRASQNPGIANPTKTKTVKKRSQKEPSLTALITPIGIAISNTIDIDNMFIRRVIGMRLAILFITFCPSIYDLPKSNVVIFLSQLRYCTYSGLSNPYWITSFSLASNETFGFNVVAESTGLPGARCITQNDIMDMPNNMGIILMRRFSIYLFIIRRSVITPGIFADPLVHTIL